MKLESEWLVDGYPVYQWKDGPWGGPPGDRLTMVWLQGRYDQMDLAHQDWHHQLQGNGAIVWRVHPRCYEAIRELLTHERRYLGVVMLWEDIQLFGCRVLPDKHVQGWDIEVCQMRRQAFVRRPATRRWLDELDTLPNPMENHGMYEDRNVPVPLFTIEAATPFTDLGEVPDDDL